MKKNIFPIEKRSRETITVDVDASAYLGNEVNIEAISNIYVEPTASPLLEVFDCTVNASTVTIGGKQVLPGRAIRFVMSGGAASGTSSQAYVVRIMCQTSRTPDLIELTVPVRVDDNPYVF